MATIKDRIQEQFETLSSGQKRVAHYIQNHMQEVALQSAHKIAMKSGVSEATVHRLAQALSYSSFSGMHQDIQQFVLRDQRAVNNFVQSTSQQEETWLEKHFTQEIENIRETMLQVDKAQIHQVVKSLLQADRIWVAGWRMGLSVTSFFSFVLKYMLGNCELIPQGGVAEYASYIQKNDVVFACGFPRYCTRTLKVSKLAKEQGATVIVLTDSILSPFAKLADLTLLAQCKSTGFLDSYTASLSVVNAIINEISYLEKDRVKHNIEKMELMFQEFQDSFEWMSRTK
ncbi:DNA-binding MurR/RpiR family transcriptional regulator [Paenibacillus anaericanus]|uniref:MurR/RpiR family transcriptional regulator n=1 Tax=Paenibacillus anaericanus TaxID=170367 RepID=A0A433Y6D1_9BACL|nr:MurR/RpiR family transcriptional regulator [Paenibacillus anaericanus]MDQ0091126.1 DNA-binding MurR/RpiR family transcriptional regulator [Paenibacillus anaericanus]RUT44600.1 MurR/RpiR family transcriptional regulator [Paenibacillus anaericanus]